ncbi:hypothetical protein [Cetobacterium somerae]
MRLNIKKIIVTFFILLVTLLVGSEQKIPNIMILDNPQKEVSTVEGLKNKEVAEMNIKVKKMDIEKLEGIEVLDGVIFTLPNLLENEEIKVVKSLENIPISSKNKRRSLYNIIETPSRVEKVNGKSVVKIGKKEAEDTNYILKMNKEAREITKIFEGKFMKNELSKALPTSEIGELKIYSIGSGNDIVARVDSFNSETNLYSFSINLPQISSKDEYGIMNVFDFSNSYYSFDYFYNISKGGYKVFYENITDKYGNKVPNFSEITIALDDYKRGYRVMTSRGESGGGIPYMTLTNSYIIIGGLTGPIDVGPYHVYCSLWMNISSKPGYSFKYEFPLIVTDLTTKKNIKYSLKGNTFNFNEKIPLHMDVEEKLSFYKSTDKDNIKIYSNGVKISTDGKASFNIDGNEFDLFFEQTHGDIARPYILFKTFKSAISLPLVIESWYDGTKLKEINVNLEIKNEDIGEVEFQVDKRLKSNTLNWIKANGDILYNLNTTSAQGNYSELIKLSGDFLNTDVTSIKDVHFIDGRPSKTKYISSKYILFATSGTDIIDEAGMPYDIPINMLKNNLVISTSNSNNPEMLNNKFLLEGTNDVFYRGNIKEVYLGEDPAEGVGTLDLTSLPFTYTGWNTTGGTGEISSTHGAPSKMNLTTGKLFNWKSAVNSTGGHIVTRLKVINKGREETVNTTNLNGTLEINAFPKNDIGINSGGFYIRKKTYDSTPETYEIEIYNKEIFLGKLNLTITNHEPSFEIIGDDIIDFGAIIQGKSQTLDSNIVIKSLSSDKIIDIKLEKDIKIFKKSDSNTLLPTMGDLSIQKIGEESHIKTHLTINPTENQPIGDYEGEIILYIYIE